MSQEASPTTLEDAIMKIMSIEISVKNMHDQRERNVAENERNN